MDGEEKGIWLASTRNGAEGQDLECVCFGVPETEGGLVKAAGEIAGVGNESCPPLLCAGLVGVAVEHSIIVAGPGQWLGARGKVLTAEPSRTKKIIVILLASTMVSRAGHLLIH